MASLLFQTAMGMLIIIYKKLKIFLNSRKKKNLRENRRNIRYFVEYKANTKLYINKVAKRANHSKGWDAKPWV